MAKTRKDYPILIVDDDPVFRQIVRDVLRAHHYEVTEATSAKEASSLVTVKDFVLAIVDFRMPEVDGMTWLNQLRGAGKSLPVVFVSATWVDKNTFNWLRNILRVSLILQKPIDTSLFMHQIESLLPHEAVAAEKAEETAVDVGQIDSGEFSIDAELHKLVAESPTPLEDLDKIIGTDGLDEDLLEKVRAFRKKLVKQRALNEAREKYQQQLVTQWNEMTRLTSIAQRNPYDLMAKSDAANYAHRITGTAGSLGFNEISRIARKLDELLTALDPENVTEREIIWLEVFRHLAEGEGCLRKPEETEQVTASGQAARSKILVLAQDRALVAGIAGGAFARVGEITLTDSVASAIWKCKAQNFDALVLEKDVVSGYGSDQLAAELRGLQKVSSIPIAEVVREAQPAPEAIYRGVSESIIMPASDDEFIRAMIRLVSLKDRSKPRLLTVDDDSVLTTFIGDVLSAEGVLVEGLNEPILIMDRLDEFKPDMVLLDVIMPGLSGYDVCKLIRRSERWGHLPIIFLTSKSDAEGRAAAFRAGGNDFLSKPVLVEELTARIGAHLESLHLQRKQQGDETRMGLMTTQAFCGATQELLVRRLESGGSLSFCLLMIDQYDALALRHGLVPLEQAVAELGNLVRLRFRAEDLRGQVGGQGYALAAQDVRASDLTCAVERLLAEFESHQFINNRGEQFKVSFSAGLSDTRDGARSVDELITAAQDQLRNARFKGGGVKTLG